MYIVIVKDLDSKIKYYRAKNLTEAKLYQSQTLKWVYIMTPHEFLSKLERLPLETKREENFDVIL
jgi:hypothetical protein